MTKNELREWRTSHNYSQREMGEFLFPEKNADYAANIVSNLETGRRAISPEVTERMAAWKSPKASTVKQETKAPIPITGITAPAFVKDVDHYQRNYAHSLAETFRLRAALVEAIIKSGDYANLDRIYMI